MKASIRLKELQAASPEVWLSFVLLAEPLAGEKQQKLRPKH